jgi:hypothetical protein
MNKPEFRMLIFYQLYGLSKRPVRVVASIDSYQNVVVHFWRSSEWAALLIRAKGNENDFLRGKLSGS